MISPAMGFSVLRAEAILDFPGNFQLDQLSASVRFGWADPLQVYPSFFYSVIFTLHTLFLHLLSLSWFNLSSIPQPPFPPPSTALSLSPFSPFILSYNPGFLSSELPHLPHSRRFQDVNLHGTFAGD